MLPHGSRAMVAFLIPIRRIDSMSTQAQGLSSSTDVSAPLCGAFRPGSNCCQDAGQRDGESDMKEMPRRFIPSVPFLADNPRCHPRADHEVSENWLTETWGQKKEFMFPPPFAFSKNAKKRDAWWHHARFGLHVFRGGFV